MFPILAAGKKRETLGINGGTTGLSPSGATAGWGDVLLLPDGLGRQLLGGGCGRFSDCYRFT